MGPGAQPLARRDAERSEADRLVYYKHRVLNLSEMRLLSPVNLLSFSLERRSTDPSTNW